MGQVLHGCATLRREAGPSERYKTVKKSLRALAKRYGD